MKPLENAHPETFRAVQFVLTDMEETLIYKGNWLRLPTRRWKSYNTPYQFNGLK